MKVNEKEHQVCTRGIWDTTVPGIRFDENGVSNYAKMFDTLCADFPSGKLGEERWRSIVREINQERSTSKYNCVIGVSGGTDSSYLLHLAKAIYGLKPLAVNLDNGWNSDIAVRNIRNVTHALNIDLETYVVDYEEMKDVFRCYIKAGLPWVDNPSDMAIQAALFKIASQENIKHVLIGNDFRSEGKQPSEWTYSDHRQLKYLHKKFGKVGLHSFPTLSIFKYIWLGIIRKIKFYYPYNYLTYSKQQAQQLIKEQYGWDYYGEHHHENLFTKWAISYWMYEKFGIDKRLITYSAQVLSGAMTRDEALKIVTRKPYDPINIQQETKYVLKKISMSEEEFEKIWDEPNKSFLDYPSYYNTIKKNAKLIKSILNRFFNINPKIFVELSERKA